ncbi:hypothetical protein ACJMK2_027388 [Sinanodonta woodiana]
MKENIGVVVVISVIFLHFGEVDSKSVHLVPSPKAQVEEGNELSLHCSYDGNSPDFINWYLNDDTVGLVIEASSCNYLIIPGQYEIDRYVVSCHETKFTLSITSISKNKDNNATWKCDTTVIGMQPPQKASTTIVVIDAGTSGQLLQTIIAIVSVLLPVAIIVFIAVAVYRKRKKWFTDCVKNRANNDHNLEQMCMQEQVTHKGDKHQEQTDLLGV